MWWLALCAAAQAMTVQQAVDGALARSPSVQLSEARIAEARAGAGHAAVLQPGQQRLDLVRGGLALGHGAPEGALDHLDPGLEFAQPRLLGQKLRLKVRGVVERGGERAVHAGTPPRIVAARPASAARREVAYAR